MSIKNTNSINTKNKIGKFNRLHIDANIQKKAEANGDLHAYI